MLGPVSEKEIFMFPVLRKELENAAPEEKERMIKNYNRICRVVGYDKFLDHYEKNSTTPKDKSHGLFFMILGLIMPLIGLLLYEYDFDQMTDDEVKEIINKTLSEAKSLKDNNSKEKDNSEEGY